MPSTWPERFWNKVEKADGCWLWRGAIRSGGGYGAVRGPDGKAGQAHRWAYRLVVGEIPAGLVIDHLCRNRACVNPAHLEVVTQGENIRRGDLPKIKAAEAAARTHCRNGHARAEHGYHSGTRWHCRACHRATARRAYHRQKARA